MFATTFTFGEAADYEFLLGPSLNLQPIPVNAFQVGSADLSLGNDALKSFRFG